MHCVSPLFLGVSLQSFQKKKKTVLLQSKEANSVPWVDLEELNDFQGHDDERGACQD